MLTPVLWTGTRNEAGNNESEIRPISYFTAAIFEMVTVKNNHSNDSVLYLGLSYLVDLAITPMIGK